MRSFFVVLLIPLALRSDEPVRVAAELDSATKAYRFVFVGIDPEKAKSFEFRVVVAPSDLTKLDDQPALSGETKFDGDKLVFAPKYPPTPGVGYVVSHRLHPKFGFTQVVVTIPKPKLVPTVVEAVYPSGSKLPENQLKFYLHFSAAMSRGEAYDHIRLLDSKGKPVEKAFVELEEELWDRDQKRFTLLIDPGRIKRGLKPREDLGPVLEEGKSYTLVVAKSWRDGNGEPIQKDFRKSFSVGPPDEKQPNPADWKMTAPTSKTESLKLKFPEPLDRALLQRMLTVVDSFGNEVEGRIEVSDEETIWKFSPDGGWKAGKFKLVVDRRLEDLAGNSIARPFETEESMASKKPVGVSSVEIPFQVND